jgi:four helix bundle protein
MLAKRFEDLIMWRKARVLTVSIYRASDSGKFARDFGLKDQIRRAAVSVMSNIAEGFARFGREEFRRFLTIALASSAEVRSQLYVAYDLGYITEETRSKLAEDCIEIDRLISSFRKYLSRYPQ